MPLYPCRECGTASANRYCAKHANRNRETRAAQQREIERRTLGLKRFYDSADWRLRTRTQVLARDPLCQIAILCEGRAVSTDVDHIVRAEIYIAEHGGDQTYFYDAENLRGACHECHARKTSLEQRGLWREPAPCQ